MKHGPLPFLFLALVTAGISAQVQTNGQGDEIIVYRLPTPERVYIYRDGTVVYDAAIPGNAIINNTFILRRMYGWTV